MANPTLDLGKFNYPNIFIIEQNSSIVTPVLNNQLINLVPGFSKKGPINNPTYITNSVDFINTFGDLDKQLERKGSYFHRTCLQMLKSGPIFCLNLLQTLDSRDKAQYEAISLGSYYDNSSVLNMPYSRLFNRQDFWTRDDESFMDYVNPDSVDTDHMMYLTNLGDKTTTTFIFKSSISGFDITAENWYGGITKVPAYIHPKDWISDYIVTVLVLEGDWTNYQLLSVDTTWSKYFNLKGLMKAQVSNFVNNANVKVLANYDCSIIPYFQDLNGRNMYIKNVINNDTNTTGLFSTYNEDYILGSDYPTGKLDVIGNDMVNVDKDYIDFLSYNTTISENLTYSQVVLDSSNNVFGNYSTDLEDKFPTSTNRDAKWTNGYINNAEIGFTGQTLVEISDFNNGKISLTTSPTYYSNGIHNRLNLNDVVYFNMSFGPIVANTPYYIVNTYSSSTIFEISTSLGGSPIYITPSTAPAGMYIQRISLDYYVNNASYFTLNGNQYSFLSATTQKTSTSNTAVVFDPLDLSNPGSGNIANRYDVLY